MSFRIMKPLTKFIAAASVLSAATLMASILPASASMSNEVILYNANPQGPYRQGVELAVYSCAGGTHGIKDGALSGVMGVANGCGTRVWLHEFPDGSGWSYCVSPYHYTSLPSWAKYPNQLLVSANTAGCGSGSMAYEVILYGNKGDQAIGCIGGSHGVEEDNLMYVKAVANGCGTRVWLHQYPDGSGWSYCVSPYHYTTLPTWAESPAQLLVSANTAGC